MFRLTQVKNIFTNRKGTEEKEVFLRCLEILQVRPRKTVRNSYLLVQSRQ